MCSQASLRRGAGGRGGPEPGDRQRWERGQAGSLSEECRRPLGRSARGFLPEDSGRAQRCQRLAPRALCSEPQRDTLAASHRGDGVSLPQPQEAHVCPARYMRSLREARDAGYRGPRAGARLRLSCGGCGGSGRRSCSGCSRRLRTPPGSELGQETSQGGISHLGRNSLRCFGSLLAKILHEKRGRSLRPIASSTGRPDLLQRTGGPHPSFWGLKFQFAAFLATHPPALT